MLILVPWAILREILIVLNLKRHRPVHGDEKILGRSWAVERERTAEWCAGRGPQADAEVYGQQGTQAIAEE